MEVTDGGNRAILEAEIPLGTAESADGGLCGTGGSADACPELTASRASSHCHDRVDGADAGIEPPGRPGPGWSVIRERSRGDFSDGRWRCGCRAPNRLVSVSHSVGSGVRIAELVGTLSYAADLGLGQPMDHCLRQTVIAGRLARLAGASDRDVATTFYLGLLMNAHCHADAAEQATWFDDDIGFKSEGVETLGWNTAQIIAFFVRRLGFHGSASARAKRLVTFRSEGSDWFLGPDYPRGDGCQVRRADWAGPGGGSGYRRGVRAVGRQGCPHPAVRGTDRAASRLVQLASPVEVFSRRHGTRAAVAMVRRNAGTQFDPPCRGPVCCDFGVPEVLDGVDEAADWDAVLNVEPEPCRSVAGQNLTSCWRRWRTSRT